MIKGILIIVIGTIIALCIIMIPFYICIWTLYKKNKEYIKENKEEKNESIV